MIMYVVAREVGNCDAESQLRVANTILNRLKDERFPDSVHDILHAQGQYGSISNYYSPSVEPDDLTIQMVCAALDGEDNSNGALAYYAPQYLTDQYTIDWFESLEYLNEYEGIRYFKW